MFLNTAHHHLHLIWHTLVLGHLLPSAAHNFTWQTKFLHLHVQCFVLLLCHFCLPFLSRLAKKGMSIKLLLWLICNFAFNNWTHVVFGISLVLILSLASAPRSPVISPSSPLVRLRPSGFLCCPYYIAAPSVWPFPCFLTYSALRLCLLVALQTCCSLQSCLPVSLQTWTTHLSWLHAVKLRFPATREICTSPVPPFIQYLRINLHNFNHWQIKTSKHT